MTREESVLSAPVKANSPLGAVRTAEERPEPLSRARLTRRLHGPVLQRVRVWKAAFLAVMLQHKCTELQILRR